MKAGLPTKIKGSIFSSRAIALLLLALLTLSASAQSTFQNLDFEAANIPAGTPIGAINASDGVPGWSVLLDDQPSATVGYNGLNLDLWDVEIEDRKSNWPPLVGAYGLFMQGGRGMQGEGPAAIAQVAGIDAQSHSLLFSANVYTTVPGVPNPAIDVSFKGQSLSVFSLSISPSFTTYGADVSAFAGQAGELRFTTPFGTSAFLDDIQFSSQVIPEPSTIALLAAGAVILGGRLTHRRK